MENNIEISEQSKVKELYRRVCTFLGRYRGVALLYAIFYTLLFLPIFHGAGQYWDWNFPYFKDQVPNIFWNYAFSWLGADTGAPMSYLSDYYVRMLFSLTGYLFLEPEYFRYFFIVGIFTVTSFGTYLFVVSTVPSIPRPVAFIAGVAALVNPLMFYKLLAGHINYFISYAIFVYLAYFLVYRYDPNKNRHAIVLGLFLAFIGAQIQFFAFALVFIAAFLFVQKSKRGIRALVLALSLCFLINLPWLSNFIVGGIDLSTISSSAAKASFDGLGFSHYIDIFTMKFSKATLIDRFYDSNIMLSFSGLYMVLFLLVLFRRGSELQKPHAFQTLYMFLLIGSQLALIIFSNLTFVRFLTPMFREFGHIGPIVVFSLIVTLVTWPVHSRERWLIGTLCLVFVAVNIPVFFTKLPALDFRVVREHLTEFKGSIDLDNSSYRVMSFPFFTPYSFTFSEIDAKDGFSLNNAGHDSFMSFSGKSRLSNLIPGYAFLNSPQALLIQSLNLNIVRPYNIKYIFDLSSIYKSEYKRFLPENIYKGRESIFAENSDLIDRLNAANPGQLQKISQHVYSVQNVSGRAFAFADLWCLKSPEWNSVLELDGLFGSYGYTTRTNCDPSRQASIVNFKELTRRRYIDTANATLKYPTANLFAGQKLTLYSSPSVIGYFAKIDKGIMVVTAKPQATVRSGDASVLDIKNDIEILGKFSVRDDRLYYAKVGHHVLGIPENVEVYLGSVADAPYIEIFTDGPDLLLNKQVSEFDVLNTETPYLISYDYKGAPGSSMGYSIDFESKSGIKNTVQDYFYIDEDGWRTYKKMFLVDGFQGDEAVFGKLRFDSDPGVEYKNKRIVQLRRVEFIVGSSEDSYRKKDISDLGTSTDLIYDQFGYSFKNLIMNGSFESGLWHDKPIVCHKNTPSADVASVTISTSEKTDGRQSVELRAKDNVACIKTDVKLNAGSTFVLSFDFKGVNSNAASYRIDYNDSQKSQYRDSKPVTQAKWNTYEKEITVPVGATAATIYFFARGDSARVETVNWYDKISLIELPPLNRTMYLVGELGYKNIPPDRVEYQDINFAKSEITVIGARNPFYLGLSEAYNQDWKIRPRFTKGGISANPFNLTGVVVEDNHYRVNEYFNAWYINPAEYCAEQAQTCTVASDGTYTINLTAEFWPQRWFAIFLNISFMSLLFCVLSLIHAYHLGHINYFDLLFRRFK